MMPILISHHDSRGDDDDNDDEGASLEKTIKNKKVVVATIETPEKERKANVSCTHIMRSSHKSRFICLKLHRR